MQTNPFDDDKLHEECGIFGIFGTSDAAANTVLGLHALQHRGQEASGIVTFDGRLFHNHRAAGLVGDIFGDPRWHHVEGVVRPRSYYLSFSKKW